MTRNRSSHLLAVAVVAFTFGASACATEVDDPVAGAINTSEALPAVEAPPTEEQPAAPPAPVSFGIGDTIAHGDWEVTVHQVIDPFAPDVGRPADGHRWIEIDAEVSNVSDDTGVPSPLLCFRLMNTETNHQASVSLIVPSTGAMLDGQVSVGQSLRGGIVYEIPVEWASLRLEFDCSQLGTPAVMVIG